MSNATDNVHVLEAFRLLAGHAQHIHLDGSIHHVFPYCTIAMDLRRIDQAIGPSGSTPFAAMADTIQAVFVELTAALGGSNE